jgi:hypothetical protein
MVKAGIDWAVVPFQKSSYSTGQGGNCVEIGWAAVPFRKSSYSGTDGGNCVEIGVVPTVAVGIRDSKQGAAGPVLEFAPSRAATFFRAIRSGDLPSPTV